ncbi:MAG: hypothetical protein ACPGOV_08605 [Magnetovibrionaceae bacterium]
MFESLWCWVWEVTEVYRWFFGFAFFCAGAFVIMFKKAWGRGLALIALGVLINIAPIAIAFLAHDNFGVTLPTCQAPHDG